MANAVVPFEQQMTLADAVAKSSMFGIKTREQALVLMALCEAENLHPIVAVRDFNIIQGRPALKADAMLTRFQAAGGKVRWVSYTDDNVTGEFSHPQGGIITVDWTMERARKAGLAGKGPWLTYPRAMLRARVISEAIRSVFPGVLSGLYTPEENADMEPDKPMRNVTPPKPRALSQEDKLRDFAGEHPSTAGTGGSVEETPPAVAHDAETGEVYDPPQPLAVPDKGAPVKQWQQYRDDLVAAARGAPSRNWLADFEQANHDGMVQLAEDFPKAAAVLRAQIAGRATELGA